MDGSASQHIGEAVVGGLVIVKQIADVVRGRANDRRHRSALYELKTELLERLNGFDRRIDTLFAFVIGPDGENGIRGDLREFKARVIGLEERERDQPHPSYDRRRT